MNARLRRTWLATCTAWLACALGTLGLASAAAAGQPSGTAHVETVDLRAGTVMMLGETYRVLPSTLFVDARGRRAELSSLRPIPTGAAGIAEDEADVVRWKASEMGGVWVLDEIRIVAEMPD